MARPAVVKWSSFAMGSPCTCSSKSTMMGASHTKPRIAVGANRVLHFRQQHTDRGHQNNKNSQRDRAGRSTVDSPALEGTSSTCHHSQDFILSVLEAHPSARDSRFYLQNFGASAAPPPSTTRSPNSPNSAEVPAFPLSNGATPTTAFAVPVKPSTGTNAKLDDDIIAGKTPFADELLAPENRHTALVKIQGPFTERQLESIAEGMVYLKKLGLVSIIVVDHEEWMSELSRDNIRASDLSTEERRARTVRLRAQMKADTMKLCEMLERKGGSARPLLEGVLCVRGAEFKDSFKPIASTSKLPTEPESSKPPSDLFVDSLSGIRDSIRRGEIPVIPPIALDQSLFSLCVSANDAVRAISAGLADHAKRAGLRYEADRRWNKDVDLTPVRLMIINQEGGIPSHARRGNPHLSINLSSEFDYINQTFVWQESHPTSLANLALLQDCLAELPRTASAVLVSHRSPRSLIANLITNKPAHSPSLHQSLLPNTQMMHQPTIVRRGLPIRVFRKMSDIDLPALTRLLEASFGKTLDAEPFCAHLDKTLDFCIIAGDYQGVAIVTNEAPSEDPSSDEAASIASGDQSSRSIAYLDKFAVLPSLQGDGTVDFLWGALRDESFGLGLLDALNPNVGGKQGLGEGRDLVWRSRSNNPVNKWYFERSNGFFKIPPPRGSQVGFALFWCEKENRRGESREAEDEASKATASKLKEWSRVVGNIPTCWK
ncbi:BQ2448_1809 [Microbotryum intermedium]|uniref:Amino-acid acetyltransferase, mitochondrial n=1 Tax=Microbotryum intermedium TaxID=269621 RepID=A0A238FB33_9BASI|nr:BQ2448_1809 [Microbotryum intermedium]